MRVNGPLLPLAALALAGGFLGCSGTPSGPGPTLNQEMNGTVALAITDAPTDDWAEIGVLIRSIALVPKGQADAAAVVVYDGTLDTVPFNLVHLDHLAQVLEKASVPAGTYDRVVVKMDADPTKILLAPSLDASGNPQDAIPSDQILVNGAKDAKGWVALPTLRLRPDLVVTAGSTSALQVDFDLGHPLFVVVHDEVIPPLYTLDFQIRHKPAGSLPGLVLRHSAGQVTSVASAGGAFTLRTDHGKNATLDVDAAHRTIFYDLDGTPVTGIPAATVPQALTVGKYAKASARFQNDGSLTAVRVWFSADATRLPRWTPEGHVVRVDPAGGFLWVLNENGRAVRLAVDDTTTFVFQGGTTPIGTGKAFLPKLGRDFKVHVTVADPAALPLVAREVDIQRGVHDGDISAASLAGFSYRKAMWGQTDANTLGYGADFSWWNFAFPTLASSDKALFVAKATGDRALAAHGASTLEWDAAAGAWAAKDTVFMPTLVSGGMQRITSAYVPGTGSLVISFSGDPTAGAGVAPASLTVNLSAATGAQTVVTDFRREGRGMVVSTLDPTVWATRLTLDARVRVFGIPRGDGTLDAYVVNLFE